MEMEVPLELFLTGLTLGFGPCLLFCVPIIIPYVAGTSSNWMEGLKATMAFSLSRLSAYILLGLAAGYSGMIMIDFLSHTSFCLYIWIVGGLFISFLGLLILFGLEPRLAFHRVFKLNVDGGLLSLVFLGFVVGMTPCAPLIGVLTYIALDVRTPLAGAFHTLCFGLGASIVSPVILLGVVAGGAPSLIFKMPRIHEIFKRSCGVMLILLGVRQIASQLASSVRGW